MDQRAWYSAPYNADLPHGTFDPKAILPPPNHLGCRECREAILALRGETQRKEARA